MPKGKKKNPQAPRFQFSRKAQRRAEAEARNAEHAKLSPAQKLAKLDRRFGFDLGATKERARLQALRDRVGR